MSFFKQIPADLLLFPFPAISFALYLSNCHSADISMTCPFHEFINLIFGGFFKLGPAVGRWPEAATWRSPPTPRTACQRAQADTMGRRRRARRAAGLSRGL